VTPLNKVQEHACLLDDKHENGELRGPGGGILMAMYQCSGNIFVGKDLVSLQGLSAFSLKLRVGSPLLLYRCPVHHKWQVINKATTA
jgi:hypothetical protein